MPDAVVKVNIRQYHRDLAEVEVGAVVNLTEWVDRIETDPGECVSFHPAELRSNLRPRPAISYGLIFRDGGFSVVTSHGCFDRPPGSWSVALDGIARPKIASVAGIELWTELSKALDAGFTTADFEAAFGSKENGAALIRGAALAVIEAHIEGLPPKLAGRFYAIVAAAGTVPSYDQADAVSPLAVEVFGEELRGYVAALAIGDLFEFVAELVE